MAKEISSELLNTILTRVGGPGNIASCGNCMTRLRLGVHDSSLVDPDIKTLEGVKGVILTSDQVQVVFGPGKAHRAAKAMSELLGELAEAVDAIDEDVTHAYDQINDLSEELEDLEADLYEDDDTDDDDEEPEEDAEDAEDSGDDDDNADVAGEPYYEVACPACGNTVYVSEDDLDAGEAICPSCNVAFEVALADEDDDEAPEEPDDGPARYEVTCPACGATSVVDEEALLDGEPVCPACGKPLDFEVTEE